MKAFQFPLERALHVRRIQLDIEQSKLNTLFQQAGQIDQQCAEVLSQSAATRHAITTELVIQSGQICTVSDYQRTVKRLLIKLNQEKREVLKRVEFQRQLTLEAKRKVKLLEQLREKRFSEWNASIQRDQETFAADAYLARWSGTK